jgi:type IV secretion system protein VirB9|tara:strand:+ start:16074 stop:16865 length:792 start_codon:yes stop_codon:yes gene_type:complete
MSEMFKDKAMTRILTVLLVLGVIGLAQAEETPRSLAKDSRIKLIQYDENNVFKVVGYDLIQTSIEFHPNEIILDVTSGDSLAWQWEKAAGRDNILFIKPMLDVSDTNMKVITNKRIYEFRLVANHKNINHEDITYKLKFQYPREQVAIAKTHEISHAQSPQTVIAKASDPTLWNFKYSYSGNNRVAPVQVFDNQKDFTYFRFKDTSSIPAIYAVESNRKEQIVNYRIEGEYVVVEKVTGQYTLRDGNLVTTVINENFIERAVG